jgi:hypothetical protein
MTKHTIIGRFGSSDPFSVPQLGDEVTTILDLVTPKKELDHGLGHAINDLVSAGLYPSEIGIDVMILAAHIYAADTRISRQSESQDSWTREMRLVVPVSEPER